MKNLIAVTLITAGTLGQDLPAVQAGEKFSVEDDDLAAKLVADGLAKDEQVNKDKAPAADPATKAKQIKARLLVDSDFGKCNEVVLLEIAVAKAAEKQGIADTDKAAVTYAESLKADK